MSEYIDYYDKVVKEISKEKDEDIQRMFDNIITEINLIQQHAILRAKEEKRKCIHGLMLSLWPDTNLI